MQSLTKLRKEQLTHSRFTHLQCAECGRTYDKNEIHFYCNHNDCNSPLLAVYDLENAVDWKNLKNRPANMWRYQELLPVQLKRNILTLGEGMTPLLPTRNLARKLGIKHLFIKDESINPTGSFKARGLAMAVSRAKELGIELELEVELVGDWSAHKD